MKRFILLTTIAIIVSACGYNDFGDPTMPTYQTLPPNADIGFIASMYRGTPLEIRDDVVVSGIVTANDLSNNFYRTFIIQDATGAVEVMAGMFDLHNFFPLGRRISVKANGLAIDNYNGILRLGLKPAAGSSQAGYISTRYYPGTYFWPQSERAEVMPAEFGISELTDAVCGLLIRIEGLTFVPGTLEGEYITWSDGKTNGYRVFRDGAGREITVITSAYASFSGEQVSQDAVALTGILMKGNTDKSQGVYMLKLRDIADVEAGA